jgi:hypothetical protein
MRSGILRSIERDEIFPIARLRKPKKDKMSMITTISPIKS